MKTRYKLNYKIIFKLITYIYLISFSFGILKVSVDPSPIYKQLNNTEKYYNEHTSGWQDFLRMSNEFDILFQLAFIQKKDVILEFWVGFWAWINGEFYYFDSWETQRTYEVSMRYGLSTRGGIWELLINVVLYSAYPFGNLIFWTLLIFLFLYFIFPGRKYFHLT